VIVHIANVKFHFCNARGFDTDLKNVLVIGYVVRISDSFDVVEKAVPKSVKTIVRG
jgi:hypothetical protein